MNLKLCVSKLFLPFLLSILFQITCLARVPVSIPVMVADYVKINYPLGENIVWKKEGKNYIVNFINANAETSLCITQHGKVLNKRIELNEDSQIPEKIQSQIHLKDLLYSERYESRGGVIFYILEMTTGESEIDEYVFDHRGNLINGIEFVKNSAASCTGKFELY